jgi:hypothetical protein
VPFSRFEAREALVDFYRRLAERVGVIPGVEAVSGVSVAPFGDGGESTSVGFEGLPENSAKPEMQRRVVLPGFFDVMQIPVRHGTAVLDGRLPTVAVSETMAARLWPGLRAVGQRISLRDVWFTVEGVVADVRAQALNAVPQGTYYIAQETGREATPRMRLLVRTGDNAEAVPAALRRVIAEVDSTIPVGEVATINALLERSLASERYRTVLVNVFAGASLLVAAVGIFGVTLRLMLRRRRELGVRLALGARPGRLAAKALGLTMAGAAAGLGIGAGLAALALPTLSAYLYQLPARDPATFAASAALLFVVSLGASAIPVVGALRMNVVEVLRED